MYPYIDDPSSVPAAIDDFETTEQIKKQFEEEVDGNEINEIDEIVDESTKVSSSSSGFM